MKSSKSWTMADAKAHGYSIGRSGYLATVDDNIDSWYWDPPGTEYIGRRGSGWATRREALEAAQDHYETRSERIAE